MNEASILAAAKKNSLQWDQVKKALSLGSFKNQDQLMAMKPTQLATEVARLKKAK